ncbi:CKLF-like MARVEL transmembrane domain-containing protein 2B isoform X1 [Arvicanthis niloticus]|uniref:CKLF-like MARVEL transmembrane domain-containing protein 2B isoform X1 n=1 Tax=Arvicanthis niloticus TaxID=61156 RepID=UPI0014870DBF|nr:CKLF-like MARVEL transmembrane domain-containing protein 2B [Arvicanthis niloticus]
MADQKGRPAGKKGKEDKRGFNRYKWEFKDSNKDLWMQGHGETKFLSMICITVALICLERVATHPMLILLLTMELSILSFFFFLYSFAINRYIPFVFWPMMDFMNDLFCTIFLIYGIVFAFGARRAFPEPYLTAMIFMGIGAFITLVDLCLQRKHFKSRRLRRYALLAPDKDGKMPDKGLLAQLAAKEDEEEEKRRQAEKEKKEKEAAGW